MTNAICAVAHKRQQVDSQSTYFDDVARSFDKASEQYNDVAKIQKVIAQATYEMIPMRLYRRALDIGCGTGRHTAQLLQKANCVQGVDISTSMVTFAKSHYPNINFKLGNAQALPLGDSSVDLCYSTMALQWCQSPEQVINEVHRVLAPKGHAVLAIMTSPSWEAFRRAQQQSGMQASPNHLFNHEKWLAAVNTVAWASVDNHRQEYSDKHPSLLALLRSISHVGAGKQNRETKGQLTKGKLAKLENVLRSESPNGELLLNYGVSHFVLEKQ